MFSLYYVLNTFPGLTSDAETDHVDMPNSTNIAASNPVSYCEKLGAELDKLLQESFERLGRSKLSFTKITSYSFNLIELAC